MISVCRDIGYLKPDSEMEGQLLDIKKNFFFGLWSIKKKIVLSLFFSLPALSFFSVTNKFSFYIL